MSTSDANYWLDPECARAYWDQYRALPYQELLEDTLAWLEPRPGERWLDLGCGGGQLTMALWRASGGRIGEIVSMDVAAINVRKIDKCRLELRPRPRPEQIRFVEGNFSDGLPQFESASLDGIVSGLAIHYAESKDPVSGAYTDAAYNRLLAEMFRVLRPGGSLVFSVSVPEPAFWSVFWKSIRLGVAVRLSKPGRVLQNALQMMQYGRWLKQEARRGRFHYLPLADIEQRLIEVGFRDLKSKLSFAKQAYLVAARKPGDAFSDAARSSTEVEAPGANRSPGGPGEPGTGAVAVGMTVEPRRGKRIKLSPARRLVVEWLHHARKVPSLPLAKTFDLSELLAARRGLPGAPSWIAIFMKAYGLAARQHPELRQAYVRWPVPHLYEHPVSECAVLIEREWAGEPAVFGSKIRGPENQPLADIDEALARYREAPLEEIGHYRKLMRTARMPQPVRRFLFWHSIQLSGATRARRFGTFMMSSLGNLGVEQFHPLTFLTTYLTFGPISPAGQVVVKIIYDHRVMDGRTVARCLNSLDQVLKLEILLELRGPQEIFREHT